MITSYSQQGEDLLLQRILRRILKEPVEYKGFYVDVGAHHPTLKSNTKLIYEQGFCGINIDMQKRSIELFNIERPDCINIQCAVSDKEGEVISYIDPNKISGTATCSTEVANKFIERKLRLTEVIVPARVLSDIIDEHSGSVVIDYLNIDVEGFEMNVLRGLDFKRHRPRIISIEIHAKSVEIALSSEVAQYLKAKGYICIASAVITYFFILKR